jgi:hypothetical protein
MEHTTRAVLIAGFLGVSIIASGAVGRAEVSEASGVQTYLSGIADVHVASMRPDLGSSMQRPAASAAAASTDAGAAVYFPSQYVLNAPAGTSDPISTF